jgi:hypothetical protein
MAARLQKQRHVGQHITHRCRFEVEANSQTGFIGD